MWQLYVLGSLFATSGEYVTDKIAIVTDRRIGISVATFWRMVMFVVCVAIIGFLGVLGHLSFVVNPIIAFIGFVGVGNSLIYTSLLKRLEVTGIGAISYLAPFAFLLIDTQVLHTSLTSGEIAGIFLMVLGGFSFAIDGKTHHFKREFSPFVWLMFIYMVCFTGIEAYAFKLMNASSGMSAPTFFVSTCTISVVVLLMLVVAQGNSRALFKRPALIYIPRVAISKTFDSIESVLWAQALTLAAVSQVSAMESLEPLVLFIVTILAQDLFRFRAGEKLGRSRMRWKAAAVTMLVLGGLLVS